ncbi:hypothetical protein CN571_15210 [Bacillus pseudomycoides]|uniref:Tetratricopeptide repeat protein n=3 Tax=Bacillus pseudomycoides TaxID=64104 RepID=A0ABD6T927_9BACI|nr:hypothetical protein CN571_15210 [Bacillus pseudomycoides]PEP71722.1 hypothetical protein CN584_29845 [Bacillus pseudomycoides]PGF06431.1 hypothetical protein COM59_24535 [Bacillus pseudomycoides]PHE99356.1 hypothetical protein COF81_10350 [Bacillus pseudomycoides]
MSQVMEDNLRRIHYLLKVSDADRAMKEAEMLIKEDPADACGYLCLSYVYFHGFSDNENASKYLEEALKLDHLNEQVLSVGLDIFSGQNNHKRIRELAEVGIKNHPENGKYYFYMGEAVRCFERIKNSLVYFEKAMELEPENEVYVGKYAYILFTSFPKRQGEALKAEKRALELNPENTTNLVLFAVAATHKGNFKKARMLAEVAMQLDPNDKEAYMIYKKTIGTKNKFCDFTARLAHVLGLPISKFCSLFTFVYFKNKNIYYFLYFLSIFGWVILPVYLTGWYAGSVYIVFLMMFFISSKIQQNIYKEVGLGTSFDAKDNLRSNKFSREQETTKMARTVEKVEPTKKLSPEEIEAQVTSFGSKGAVFEKQPIEEVARKPQLSSEEHKEIQSYSNIKSPRYNKWYICLLIILSLILVFRVGKLYNSNHNEDKNTVPSNSEEERKDYNFNLKEDKNAVPNNSEEEWKSIVVSKDKISKEEKMEQIYLASSTLYLLETSDFSENSLRQFVMDNYVSVVMEKAGQPSIQKLKSENLARIYKEGTNTYLLVKSDDSTFILEISEKKINRIYGENWDNSEQEIKIYHELLNKFKMESVQQE